MLGIASLAARLGLRAAPGLTRVWRGVEPAHKGFSMAGKSYPSSLKGRFFTTNLGDAKWYAHRQGTKSGLVQYLDLPSKQFNIGTKLSERLDIPKLGGQVIIPKKYLTSGNISTDYIKSIAARFRSIMGDHLYKGGLAGILEI